MTAFTFDADPRLSAHHIGEVMGESDPRRISQNQINEFARVTGDLQWVHVNPERAGQGPYGGTIAHGYLVLALLPSLTKDVIDFSALGTVINYGLNKVRFVNPARVDATLADQITLKSLEERPAGILIGLTHTVIEPEGGKIVCVADTLTLLKPSL